MRHHAHPYAASRPLDINTVDITGGFWKRITDRSRTVGLPALLTEYENRNIVRNFIAAAKGWPRAKEENAGNYDEFLFKALEACNYYLGQTDTIEREHNGRRHPPYTGLERNGILAYSQFL